MLGKVLLCSAAVLLCIACEDSQQPVAESQLEYSSPIDFDILLAGNFGEPRPWHFHGGLDIKTDNQEGKRVLSVADGYVSRLTVGLFGFGNAVYVCHPDGHTSVYAHLQRFADVYEQLIKRTGRADTIDVRLPEGKYAVRAGDFIALSGNTGHSTGPHLHLEIHDTKTWVLRDPMVFLSQSIADTVAPQAHSFMAVPIDGEGVFNGGQAKQTFAFGQPSDKRQRTTWTVSREFTAWGRVGFALWADDYSQNVHNHYGIRSTQLLVDGREVFRSDVDSIPISCHPEVNLWGDYDHWARSHTWYMKSYREPGLRLPVLHTGFDRGIVTFSEERPYIIKYVLRDFHGNTSEYQFTVQGLRDDRIPNPVPRLTLLDDYRLYGQCLWPLHTRRL